jgi:uncharacterized protein YecE (DUF72 family)
MGGRLYLGTSGFSYDEWRHGVFYPEGLKKDDQLPYYASRLSSVEINYTFRRFPSERTLATWRERVPPGFVFTLKANQRITHAKRLAGVEEDVRDFLRVAGGLKDALGCVLFQCPPSLRHDAALIEAFLDALPSPGPGVPRFAMEFRHPSWTEARATLRERQVAWCVTESDEHDPRPEDLSWEPVGYLRLRKTAYDDEELGRWAERIRRALAEGATVFAYFKHEAEGASPAMARRLGDLVGAGLPPAS